jgi:diadenosine tetraphosphate (Ap4A) HIT family hydrolase
MYRYRKHLKAFKMQKQQAGCGLCDPSQLLVEHEYEHTYLVHNRYPYSIWENRDVLDHLMVLPKRHVANLGELKKPELDEVTKLLAEYEAKGYSIYARSVENKERSVAGHQHTHLIRISHKSPRFSMFLAKPYLLIKH